jgi:hypothetical protein
MKIMQVFATRRQVIRWLALMLLAPGCEAAAEPLAPVQGKVSYKGIALHTGTIAFTPDESRGSSGPLARAEIQPDGTYRLTTGDSPGATVGRHRVTIVSLDETGGPTTSHDFKIPRSLLPDKYRDPELSGLTCEVKAGQQNVIDFNLE